MSTIALTMEARTLLRLHFAGKPLSMGRYNPESLPGRSVEETRAAYRELVEAGLMDPVSTFVGGPGGHYRLTEAGAALLSGIDDVLPQLTSPSNPPSPERPPARHPHSETSPAP